MAARDRDPERRNSRLGSAMLSIHDVKSSDRSFGVVLKWLVALTAVLRANANLMELNVSCSQISELKMLRVS